MWLGEGWCGVRVRVGIKMRVVIGIMQGFVINGVRFGIGPGL